MKLTSKMNVKKDLISKEIPEGEYVFEFKEDHIWVHTIPKDLSGFIKGNTYNWLVIEKPKDKAPSSYRLCGTCIDDLYVQEL